MGFFSPDHDDDGASPHAEREEEDHEDDDEYSDDDGSHQSASSRSSAATPRNATGEVESFVSKCSSTSSHEARHSRDRRHHHGREIAVPVASVEEQMAAIRAALSAEYGIQPDDFDTPAVNEDQNEDDERKEEENRVVSTTHSHGNLNPPMASRKVNSPRTERAVPALKTPPSLMRTHVDQKGQQDVLDRSKNLGDGSSPFVVQPNELDDFSSEYEVVYNDGKSTPLFRAIEDGQWQVALLILQKIENDELRHRYEEHKDADLSQSLLDDEHLSPAQQLRTWVRSTGTVQTTFEWALWRRLPIHEACRRQPPAFVIALMLSAFPASARRTTQFGELPLHLAVECGAAPEVVNLLLTGYWQGIDQADQSGRTPLQILQETPDLLGGEDHQFVYDSLVRAQTSYRQVGGGFRSQIRQLEQQHMAGLAAIHHQHDVDLQLEQHQQSLLLEEVERLQLELKQSQNDCAHYLARTINHEENNKRQAQEIESLRQAVALLVIEKSQNHDRILALEKAFDSKQVDLNTSTELVSRLKSDLINATKHHTVIARQQMKETESHLQEMVRSFLQLNSSSVQHAQLLQSICVQRGIVDSNNSENDEDQTHLHLIKSLSDCNSPSEHDDDELREAEEVVSAACTAAWNSIQFDTDKRHNDIVM